MLYIVATPIGNLSDLSYRAVEILRSCDLILCEDTRHSKILLHRYDIHKPLVSYHQFNEASRQDSILAKLRDGQTIALISDAGTPGIADPGAKLVKNCIHENIPITAIPGPCAAVLALSTSGMNTERFQFMGFLPKKDGELRRCLHEILRYPGTTICYESPKRLLNVLHRFHDLAPQRQLAVGRELTKKFEEMVRGTAETLIERWKAQPPQGEIVLLVEGDEKSAHSSEWEKLSPLQHVALMEEEYKLSRKEAIRLVAEMRGVPKRSIYNEIVSSNWKGVV